MALSGLLGDVTRVKVAELLHQRQPRILHSDVPEQLARFEERVKQAGIEVRIVVGDNPPAGSIRDLAAIAIALEAASQTEYADYPEQQVQGEDGRGYFLHQQYLERLATLRMIVANAGGVVPADGEPVRPTTAGLPRSRGPLPGIYPDPVQVRGINYPHERARWEIP